MKTIYKYQLDIDDEVVVHMPINSKILTVKTQFDIPCIWAIVDTDNPSINRKFRIFGTGHNMKSNGNEILDYIDSFLIRNDSLVFHVFEVK